MWLLFGIATPIGLSLSAMTLVSQITHSGARRTIGLLMLFTGLSSSVFWPLGSFLDRGLGWQATVALFGAMNLLIAAPLHALLALLDKRLARVENEAEPALPAAEPIIVDPGRRQTAARLMMYAFSLQGFVSWGLPLLLIAMFTKMGVDSAVAVSIAALNGPATIGARFAELTIGSQLRPLTTALISTMLLPITFGLFFLPSAPIVITTAFTVLWCGANGVMAIARVTLPLTLLGSAGYGTLMGKLALPQNLAYAISPTIFAVVFSRLGLGATVALAA
jgi:hypothetical protein